MLLPETDEVAAINYVERVRRACELWLESGAIALQLAIGWAGTTGEPSLPEAQRIATERMYTERRRAQRRLQSLDPVSPDPTASAEAGGGAPAAASAALDAQVEASQVETAQAAAGGAAMPTQAPIPFRTETEADIPS